MGVYATAKLVGQKMRFKWNLLIVYGTAQAENKDAFLAELANFCSKNKEPYIIGCDFNSLRFQHKKTSWEVLIDSPPSLIPSSQLMS